MIRIVAIFFTLLITAVFADDNKTGETTISQVQWGSTAFFKKTWPSAVLFCAENGQRLPRAEEMSTVDSFEFWGMDTALFSKESRKTKCVTNEVKNGKKSLELILNYCVELQKESEQKKQEDANKTSGEKLSNFWDGLLKAGGKVISGVAGVGVSLLPGGAGSGVGSGLLDYAFSFDSSSNYPALSKDICEDSAKIVQNYLAEENNISVAK